MEQETKDYLQYRRDYHRINKNSKRWLKFHEWLEECRLEDEADAREWNDHVASYSNNNRDVL